MSACQQISSMLHIVFGFLGVLLMSIAAGLDWATLDSDVCDPCFAFMNYRWYAGSHAHTRAEQQLLQDFEIVKMGRQSNPWMFSFHRSGTVQWRNTATLSFHFQNYMRYKFCSIKLEKMTKQAMHETLQLQSTQITVPSSWSSAFMLCRKFCMAKYFAITFYVWFKTHRPSYAYGWWKSIICGWWKSEQYFIHVQYEHAGCEDSCVTVGAKQTWVKYVCDGNFEISYVGKSSNHKINCGGFWEENINRTFSGDQSLNLDEVLHSDSVLRVCGHIV